MRRRLRKRERDHESRDDAKSSELRRASVRSAGRSCRVRQRRLRSRSMLDICEGDLQRAGPLDAQCTWCE